VREIIILTAHPISDSVALREIRSADPGSRLHQWLEPGVGWVELEIGWDSLVARLRERPPVFCRHICPVQVRIPLKQDLADLDRLAEESRRLLPDLDPAQTFSVQTRLISTGWPYARYDVNERLAKELMVGGVPLDVRRPAQVVSVVLAPGQGYLGLSHAADNLSNWAGGARRFMQEEGQVSRAEFKLLEAVELFELSFPARGVALDLGASPGGWTRVLRSHEMTVIAVDPGDLDRRIASDPAVRHVRQTAQTYLPATDQQFDVILNDMRMDALVSAKIMVSAARNLKAGGWALLTLKLPKKGIERVAASAFDVLRGRYTVIGARQLFHNRNEITVALRRAGAAPLFLSPQPRR
jgi:23S rRNA (cytidine2498-2'-O)-methyltransferase